MKFSVLIPTRNRLSYLKQAIESVRSQNEQNWEIIVADNASNEDVKAYIDSFKDDRIHYFRHEKVIPVTDNWNFSLEKAGGDYFIMLGDDDALLPGYFSRMKNLIEHNRNPDLIFYDAVIFYYPNVDAHQKSAYILNPYHEFLDGKSDIEQLNPETARTMVQASMNLTLKFNYNMQYALVSMRIRDQLKPKGDFFQSPYPDYYAMNVLFLKAKNILTVPERWVIIGVTPKSFGYYYVNNIESQGTQFLNAGQDLLKKEGLEQVILPGSDLYTSWLLSMETIQQNFPEENLKVSHTKYRRLQMMDTCRTKVMYNPSKDLKPLVSKLSMGEKCTFFGMLFTYRMKKRLKFLNGLFESLASTFGAFPKYEQNVRVLKNHENVEDLLNSIKSKDITLS